MADDRPPVVRRAIACRLGPTADTDFDVPEPGKPRVARWRAAYRKEATTLILDEHGGSVGGDNPNIIRPNVIHRRRRRSRHLWGGRRD